MARSEDRGFGRNALVGNDRCSQRHSAGTRSRTHCPVRVKDPLPPRPPPPSAKSTHCLKMSIRSSAASGSGSRSVWTGIIGSNRRNGRPSRTPKEGCSGSWTGGTDRLARVQKSSGFSRKRRGGRLTTPPPKGRTCGTAPA